MSLEQQSWPSNLWFDGRLLADAPVDFRATFEGAMWMAAKPIDVYYWPTPNGHKITIMLEECGLPYTIKPINIGKGAQFKPDFLAFSPNNRMPAIIDAQGPGGKAITVFESGAILQYLGRKTGKFYPKEERARVECEEWLFWQMTGLGPMAGQAHHFRNYAPEKIKYGIDRYTNEVNRLYGVLNKRLKGREYVAGSYSIADMAIYPWVRPYKNQGPITRCRKNRLRSSRSFSAKRWASTSRS